uniref:Latent transforming growth factor beta binding protein 4 n=1 Tax=Catharus ustulatus TaxID=91951 RepID=A0A8C3Y714_CATUS
MIFGLFWPDFFVFWDFFLGNGGLCAHPQRCLCPPQFTGRFCHLEVTNGSGPQNPKNPQNSRGEPPQALTRSIYTLPLSNHREEEDGAQSMVSVLVRHPPQATVTIHSVERVRGGEGDTSDPSPAPPTPPAGRASPPSPLPKFRVLAQRGPPRTPPASEDSGFGYCFRRLRGGQCSSPLPGLRTRDICCRGGAGVAWGVRECHPCHDPEDIGDIEGVTNPGGCPHTVPTLSPLSPDVDECQLGSLCQHGLCTNTRGGFACLCPPGFLLDSSRSACISQQVLSEARGPCFRLLREGGGCALPTLRNITRQVCCCSRVGKAWGGSCLLCPPFGSEGFRELCPAGPGYHYSASDLRINTRYLGQDGPGVPLGPPRAPPATPCERPPKNPQISEGPKGPKTPPNPPKFSGPPGPSPRPPPVSPCLRDPSVCGPGRCVPRGGGGYTCVCRGGFWLSPQGTHCVDIDECRQVPPPCSPGRCENSQGSFRCICGEGFTSGPAGTECRGECGRVFPGALALCSPVLTRSHLFPPVLTCCHLCSPVPTCSHLSPPVLTCSHLFSPALTCAHLSPPVPTRSHLFPLTCSHPFSDVDECSQVPSPCAHGRCENRPGGYECVCPAGYRGYGGHGGKALCSEVTTTWGHHCGVTTALCPLGVPTHIDECENHLACPGQECVNTAGSFRCQPCPDGFSPRQGRCADVDECSGGSPCGPHGRCLNTPGSFRCECHRGYRATAGATSCQDVNECLEGEFCFPHGECVNTAGSFRCVCADGYRATAEGNACADVDECQRGSVCAGGRCLNTEGSFQCQCPAGFRTDDAKAECRDVDECQEYGAGLCGAQRCENIPGSYRCVPECQPGFRPGDSGDCIDVDECQEYGAGLCGAQRCENIPGSYRCVPECQPGFRPGDSGDCIDVDECSNGTLCGPHATCHNLPGSFQCACDPGYETARHGHHCVDVDECQTLRGVCGAERCENVEGSFLCLCPDSRQEFDPVTGRCGPLPTPQTPQIPQNPQIPQIFPQIPPGLGSCFSRACGLLAPNVTRPQCCCSLGWAWGAQCPGEPCPAPGTEGHVSLCPHGPGRVPETPQGPPKDVDECSLFAPALCRGGLCVNTAASFSCYCPSGFYFEQEHLQCVDNDECSAAESEPCLGGLCVNTVGSYLCSCAPPLVLDPSQRRCVANESKGSVAVCWQEVGPDLVCGRPRRAGQVTYTECCCLYGQAWGMDCALCPAPHSGETPGTPRPTPGTPRPIPGTPDPSPGPPDPSPKSPNPLGWAGEPLFAPPPPRGALGLQGGRGPRFEPPQDPRGGPPWGFQALGTPEEEEEEEDLRFFFYISGLCLGCFWGLCDAPSPISEAQEEQCGVLSGCSHGRCVRVGDAFTCACDRGFQLDPARPLPKITETPPQNYRDPSPNYRDPSSKSLEKNPEKKPKKIRKKNGKKTPQKS